MGNRRFTAALRAPPNAPLRYFSDPHLNTKFNPALVFSDTNRGQPEQMSEKVSDTDPICASSDSLNDCAHINSGILNKAAYLVTKGDQFTVQTMVGIETNKLVTIFISALSLMDGLADMPGVTSRIMHACTSLQLANNNNSIGTNDCTNVANAYKAVGVL